MHARVRAVMSGGGRIGSQDRLGVVPRSLHSRGWVHVRAPVRRIAEVTDMGCSGLMSHRKQIEMDACASVASRERLLGGAGGEVETGRREKEKGRD